MSKELLIPAFIGILMMMIFFMASSTLGTVFIFVPGVVVTYIFYLFTTYKKSPSPEKILPLYLLALAIQCIHFAEEYLMEFYIIIPNMLGLTEFPLNDWVIFNMGAYAIFILGGIILMKQIKVLMIIPLFFIVVGVILNTVGHIALSIMTKGYTPGLYSVFFYLIIGPVILKILFEKSKIKQGA